MSSYLARGTLANTSVYLQTLIRLKERFLSMCVEFPLDESSQKNGKILILCPRTVCLMLCSCTIVREIMHDAQAPQFRHTPHTHVHTHTHTRTHTHTHTHTLSLSLSLSLTYTHARTHALYLCTNTKLLEHTDRCSHLCSRGGYCCTLRKSLGLIDSLFSVLSTNTPDVLTCFDGCEEQTLAASEASPDCSGWLP